MRFEIRRLHDTYRYTTVYVTHDQVEAMTTADIIAVMNAGKIEQAGTPYEIYHQPRSEFVARFIGSSNVVKGRNVDERHIEFGGRPLRCSGPKLSAGGSPQSRSASTTSGFLRLNLSPATTCCRRA